MIIGNNAKTNQPVVDKESVDIKPTRADCAVDKIIKIIGNAHTKPTRHATELIFATMICIWRAIKLSEAPTWFNISSSCLCSMAIFLEIQETQTPIETNIKTKTNIVIDTNFQPAEIDVCRADE